MMYTNRRNTLSFPLLEIELDQNTFLIINRIYNSAYLTMWGTKRHEMGTNVTKVNQNHFWQLQHDARHPGYYFIYNTKFDGYRVDKWSSDNTAVGSYKSQYCSENSLWKFDSVEGNDVVIANMHLNCIENRLIHQICKLF